MLIRKGLSASANTGASWNQTYFLGLLALSCENAGLADEAFDVLPELWSTPTAPTNDGSRRSCIGRKVNG